MTIVRTKGTSVRLAIAQDCAVRSAGNASSSTPTAFLACWPAVEAEAAEDEQDLGWLLIAAYRPTAIICTTFDGNTTHQLAPNSVSIVKLDSGSDVTFDPHPQGAKVIFLPVKALTVIYGRALPCTITPVLGARNDNLVKVFECVFGSLRKQKLMELFSPESLIRSIIRSVNLGSGSAALEDLAAEPERIYITKKKLGEIRKFVAQNIEQPIDVLGMSRVARMSAGHLCRVMKHDTGLTPYQYVLTMRMDLARNLLCGSELPLVEVALSCGFANQAHFSSSFKRVTGMAPGHFRQIERQGTLVGAECTSFARTAV